MSVGSEKVGSRQCTYMEGETQSMTPHLYNLFARMRGTGERYLGKVVCAGGQVK